MTDSTFRSRFAGLFSHVVRKRAVTRRPRRVVRRAAGRGQRPLAVEPLEERALLAAAVGVYDENIVAANTVDFVAGGSSVDNVDFAASVAADFQIDHGGVIDASILTFGGYDYGVSQNKSLKLNIAEDTNYAIGAEPGLVEPISGTGAYASTGGPAFNSPYSYTSFDFEVVGGGVDEHVIEVGVTVLSFTGRDYGNVTVTGRLNGGGTVSATRPINEDAGLGDTFFGLTAPEGDHFTGFSLSYDSDLDKQLWFDDIGFRTSSPPNQAPVAQDDQYFQFEDTPLMVAAPGVLDNDFEPDADSLTAELVDGPTHGTLELNDDGSFTYTPEANYDGVDSFTYRANDGNGGVSNAATVNIRLRPVNDPPIVDDAAFSLDEGSPAGTPVGTVIASDPEGSSLHFAITSGNDAGAFAIDADTGAITVADSTPLDFRTNPQFALAVAATDDTGLTGAATITINLVQVMETLNVSIDVEPRDNANVIDLKKDHRIEMVIFSSSAFDATTELDLDSLTFGVTGDEASLVTHPRKGLRYRVRDVNGDGLQDLVLWSDTQAAGFAEGETQAVLRGRLLDGTIIEGVVAVSVTDTSRAHGKS